VPQGKNQVAQWIFKQTQRKFVHVGTSLIETEPKRGSVSQIDRNDVNQHKPHDH